MPSDSVNIVIAAQNKATRVFNEVTRDANQMFKGVGRAQKSFGSFVGPLQDAKTILESIVPMALDLAPAFRSARQELDQMTESADRLANRRIQSLASDLSSDSARANLIRDDKLRLEFQERRLEALQREADTQNFLVKQAEFALSKTKGDFGLGNLFSPGQVEAAERRVQVQQQSLDLVEKEAEAVKRSIEFAKGLGKEQQQFQAESRGIEFIKSLEEQNAQLRLSKEEMMARTAAMNTANAQQERTALMILKSNEALREKAALQKQIEDDRKRAAKEAEQIAKRAIEDARRERQRIAETQKTTIEGLKEQAIRLRDGEEAASAYRLRLQGIGDEAAGEIASIQSQLNKIGRRESTPQLQGRDQRLLTGRVTRDPTRQMSDELKTQNRLTTKLIERMDQLIQSVEQQEPVVEAG